MDKRCEPRFATDQSVTITTLGNQRFQQSGLVRNFSETGLGLLVQTEIPAGMAVRIELEDSILLGEVMYSRPLEKGFFAGVHLEQILSGLRELQRIKRRFQEATQEVPVTTH
ncbi:MAG TPA: PilZ domain-containing protein [Candidatus Sulfopaludibacter sp.]|jgi:hypothetical protein|nr:PilZ domain-containing protein [Candidatus Sulfopaludibacter sp.]